MARLQDLEEHILTNYNLLLQYEKLTNVSDRPEEGARGVLMMDKFRAVIRGYIRQYLKVCSRIGVAPIEDVRQLAAELLDQPSDQRASATALEPGFDVLTQLPGARIIRVEVSQMFRIADLLTHPHTVKAQDFYRAITNPMDIRRKVLNRGTGFMLGNLGSIEPVIISSEQFDSFWMPALPTHGVGANKPLGFFPFQLTLSRELGEFRLILDSVLESTMEQRSASIVNTQISGRLRIYPPGTGVIQLGLTIEFKDKVNVETAANVAHNIEDLLFVDPNGATKPCNAFFLSIVDDVISELFTEEGYDFGDRRWLPPETTFSIRDDEGLVPADRVNELAYLMQLAPGNREPARYLTNRITRALLSCHWQQDGILFVAGRGVALFFVAATFAEGKKAKRQKILGWLHETRELISAALYARQAFMEQLDQIYSERLLDDSFLPEAGSNFHYLNSLLVTMRLVMRAASSIRSHLERHGCGALVDFAKDMWAFNSPGTPDNLARSLIYIKEWLISVQDDNISGLRALERVVDDIGEIVAPFTVKPDGQLMQVDTSLQEELEQRLLSELTEASRILGDDGDRNLAGVERRLHTVARIERLIGD